MDQQPVIVGLNYVTASDFHNSNQPQSQVIVLLQQLQQSRQQPPQPPPPTPPPPLPPKRVVYTADSGQLRGQHEPLSLLVAVGPLSTSTSPPVVEASQVKLTLARKTRHPRFLNEALVTPSEVSFIGSGLYGSDYRVLFNARDAPSELYMQCTCNCKHTRKKKSQPPPPPCDRPQCRCGHKDYRVTRATLLGGDGEVDLTLLEKSSDVLFAVCGRKRKKATDGVDPNRDRKHSQNRNRPTSDEVHSDNERNPERSSKRFHPPLINPDTPARETEEVIEVDRTDRATVFGDGSSSSSPVWPDPSVDCAVPLSPSKAVGPLDTAGNFQGENFDAARDFLFS